MVIFLKKLILKRLVDYAERQDLLENIEFDN